MDRKPSWDSFPCLRPCPRWLMHGCAGCRCWAGLESGSELPPKPLILLSQHVSLSLKMSNPALKISTLNIFLGYWWIWWLGFKIASTFRSCFTGLWWLCQSKENCSVNCSSGLLYPSCLCLHLSVCKVMCPCPVALRALPLSASGVTCVEQQCSGSSLWQSCSKAGPAVVKIRVPLFSTERKLIQKNTQTGA